MVYTVYMSAAQIDPTQAVTIRYTNYRGETGVRTIVPISISFTSNEWHTDPQWILEAHDMDKNQTRSFAMKDIQEWRS